MYESGRVLIGGMVGVVEGGRVHMMVRKKKERKEKKKQKQTTKKQQREIQSVVDIKPTPL